VVTRNRIGGTKSFGFVNRTHVLCKGVGTSEGFVTLLQRKKMLVAGILRLL
jgi:hypothetical protein